MKFTNGHSQTWRTVVALAERLALSKKKPNWPLVKSALKGQK